MWLIVGLGNPGPKYEQTRHNAGFLVLDMLASTFCADLPKEKFSGLVMRAEVEGETLWLLKPQTFMNKSGESVQPAAAFYKVEAPRILVVHDELDLPFGEVRLKVGGGHAGHNGLRSISARLGGAPFARVRVGIGRPAASAPGAAAPGDPAAGSGDKKVTAHVLGEFSREEREKLPNILKTAAESVLEVALRGIEPAMRRFNTRPKKPKPPRQSPPEGRPRDAPPHAGRPTEGRDGASLAPEDAAATLAEADEGAAESTRNP